MPHSSELDLLFKALSDATRRDMLARLLRAESNIGELASQYDISLPAISKHIKILEKAGVIDIKKRGKERIATFNPEGLSPAQIWLSTLNDEGNLFDRLEAEIATLGEDPFI